jgi:serine/threonine protein kinase
MDRQMLNPSGRLSVTVLSARNLLALNSNGSDAYIQLTMDGQQEQKTNVVKKNVNPTYSENFSFDITSKSHNLCLSVWNYHSFGAADFMGQGEISLDEVLSAGDESVHEHYIELKQRPNPKKGKEGPVPTGDIHVRYMYSGSQSTPTSMEDFELMKVIGRGGFGKVMQVKKKDTGRIYAMKTIRKESVIQREEVVHTKTEKNVLAKYSNHPFIVGLKWSFQSPEKLYLVMDFMNGGELFTHLSNEKRFNEDRVRFYTAELLCAIGHLHENGVVYRDLKPENVLLDHLGHLRLTDFGLCKEGLGFMDTTATLCGTGAYLAPEILTSENYSKCVDWWSLGIIVWEMMCGLPPFYSTNEREMYDMILNKKLVFPLSEDEASNEGVDFIFRLLERDPSQRLGCNGVEEVKAHPWFNGIDWDKVISKSYEPPFQPNVRGIEDTNQFDPNFTNETPSDTPLDQSNLTDNDQAQFAGFSFTAAQSLRNPGIRTQ